MKLVSIIMPVHNSEKTLERSINSILCQTYFNWELLIILDNCNDCSKMIADRFAYLDRRIIVKETKNNHSGAAGARNLGIRFSKGTFIAFLDSDDTWCENKLEKQIDFMIENNLEFSYSDYYVSKRNGKKKIFYSRKNATYSNLLFTNFIGCLTVIYNCDILGKIFMPEAAVKREDYATWLKILKKGIKGYNIGLPLATYYINSSSVSSHKFQMIKWQWNLYRNIEKLNYIQSFLLTCISCVCKLFKY